MWPIKEVSVGQLVITSVRLDEDLHESHDRFFKFKPVGVVLPELEADSLSQFSITPEDVIILTDRLNDERARRMIKSRQLISSKLPGDSMNPLLKFIVAFKSLYR